MARKRSLFLRRIQSFLKLNKNNLVCRINKIKNFAYYILCLGLLLVAAIFPVVAQTIPNNLIIQNIPIETNILVQQGKVAYDKGHYREAIEKLLQAETAFKGKGNLLSLSMTLSNLSLAYQQEGEWQKADEKIKQSLNLLQVNSNDSPEKRKLFTKALLIRHQLLLATGKPEESLNMWQDTASKFRQVKDIQGEITSEIYQSIVLQELGLYREAFITLISRIQIIKNQPNSIKAIAFRTLGNILRVVGGTEEFAESEKSLDFLQSNLNETNKLNYLDRSNLLLQISLQISKSPETLLSLGNTARTAYKRAQDSYERSPAKEDKQVIDDQSKLAAEYYEQVVQESSSPIQKIQAQLNLLSLLLDYEQWITRNKEAYVQEPIDEWQKSQITLQVSNLHQLQTQIDNLPPSHNKFYAKINLAKSLMKLLAMGEHSSFKSLKTAEGEEKILTSQVIENLLEKTADQACKLGDKRAESYAWGYLGRHSYEKSEHKDDKLAQDFLLKAQNWTQKALILAEELAQKDKNKGKEANYGKAAKDIAYQWQWQLGRVLTKQGKLNKDKEPKKRQQAIAAYQVAVNILESVRSDLTSFNNPDLQFSFRDSVEPVYRELVDLLLPYNEKTKDGQSTPSSQNDLQQVKEAQEALQQAQKVIEDLQVAELENFLRCRLTNTKLVPIYKVIDEQNLNAAVIYPIILKDRLEVILKLPHEDELIRYTNPKVGKSQVESTAKKLLLQIEQGNVGEDKTAYYQEVYGWLLRDAEYYLDKKQVKTLVFVLDGALRNIPMAALHDGNHYVIEKYSVALNLGTQLTAPKVLQKGKYKVLAAGVSKATDGLKELPWVPDELKAIEDKVPGQVKVLCDDFNTCGIREFNTETLKEQIKAQPFDVIHLATHGVFSSSPDKTFLLASNKRFYLNEMSDLFRHREETRPDIIGLLVLSACQTAKGDSRAVLGIAGVSVRTGAMSTVASLFDAVDDSTAILMSAFYSKLATPNLTKAEALQQAQIDLLNQEKYQRPQKWASFVLVGNWL